MTFCSILVVVDYSQKVVLAKEIHFFHSVTVIKFFSKRTKIQPGKSSTNVVENHRGVGQSESVIGSNRLFTDEPDNLMD